MPSDMVEARRRRSADYPEYELCEEGEKGEHPDPEDPDALPCKTATQLAILVRDGASLGGEGLFRLIRRP